MKLQFEMHKQPPAHDFGLMAAISCIANAKIPNGESYLEFQETLKDIDGICLARDCEKENVVGFLTYQHLW